ncbi:MAG: hypothetical protein ACI4I6_01910 [Hominimerdicola sp.]
MKKYKWYKELDEDEINKEIRKIAKEVGILEDTLLGLSLKTKEKIFVEYSYTGKFKVVYDIMEEEMAVSDLNNVAELMKIPLPELAKLPRDIQEQLCGCWLMLQGMEEDEYIINELKEIMKRGTNDE